MKKQEINELLASLKWDGKDRLSALKWDSKERVLDFISDLLEPLQPSLSRIACLIQAIYPASPKAHHAQSNRSLADFCLIDEKQQQQEPAKIYFDSQLIEQPTVYKYFHPFLTPNQGGI